MEKSNGWSIELGYLVLDERMIICQIQGQNKAEFNLSQHDLPTSTTKTLIQFGLGR